MAEEGVMAATTGVAESHPWIIGGAVLGVVVVLYLLSSSKAAPAAPQGFNFTYGPSNAQVAAGTQLAIAQAADQTSLSVATLQAGTAAGNASQYFNYLTQAGTTAAATAATTASYNYQATTQNIAAQTQVALANTAATASTQAAAIAAQTVQAGYATSVSLNNTNQTDATQLASIAAAKAVAINTTDMNTVAAGGSASTSTAAGAANFVANLYYTILGRAPDQAGLTAWVNQLTTPGGDTQAQVIAGFVNSTEHMTQLSATKA
jgi:hypothetical protein